VSLPIKVGGMNRRISLTHADDATKPWSWDEVIAGLEAVRANPKKAIDRARQGFARWAGRLDAPHAPLRLALDMPTGIAPIGGLPKDLGQITIPPLDSLTHDAAFIASLHGRGYHQGVLDGLATFYR